MIVSGLLAFLLTIVVLNARSATVTVFVAKDDIVAGKVITEALFEAREVPSSDLDNEYASKEAITSGKNFSSRSIAKGEPLTKSALTPEIGKSNVRLQSLPIDKALAVNGEIARGDRVDVIQTFEDGEGCAFRALDNLEVLSAPSAGSGSGVLSGSKDGFVITVAITNPADDVTLAGVVATGNFQVVKTTGVTSGKYVEDPICGSAANVQGTEGED